MRRRVLCNTVYFGAWMLCLFKLFKLYTVLGKNKTTTYLLDKFILKFVDCFLCFYILFYRY